MLLDVAADGANQRGLRVSVDGFGTAAEASAISGVFGGGGVVEESDVFAARTLGGAGRTAENSGGGDGEDEGPVER